MVKDSVSMNEHCSVSNSHKRICWSAIFSGALVGLGLMFLLHLFDMTIGLSAFSISEDGGVAIAYGGVIGMFIGIIVATFVAGYTSGYLGRMLCPKRNLGILYGFITWTVILIASGSIASNIAESVSSYSSFVAGPSVSLTVNTGKQSSADVDTSKSGAIKAVKVNSSAQDLAKASFLVFVLFFIAAASTCWGASIGMSCKRDE